MFFFVQDNILYVSYFILILCSLTLLFLVYKALFLPYLEYKREIKSMILNPLDIHESFSFPLLKNDKLVIVSIGKSMGDIKTLCNQISEFHLEFSFRQKKTQILEDKKYTVKVSRKAPALYKGPYDKYYHKMDNSEKISLSDLLKKPAFFRIGKSITGKNRMLSYMEFSLTAGYLYELDHEDKTQLEGVKYTIVLESVKPDLVKDKKDVYYDFEVSSEKEKTETESELKTEEVSSKS